MKLQIQPLVALCDEKINISISDLAPSSKVKINASMRFPWAKGVLFESFACFTADVDGNVDLSKQKPDEGSYDYIDSMGLIVSMRPQKENAINKVGQNISVDSSIFIDIAAQCDQDKSTVTLERIFKINNIKNLKVSDEFVGELFYTQNTNNKTILFLGGSGGSLGGNLPAAALLASHGFNVLTVAYFKERGLPATLMKIPLEYFEGIFKWLSENPITEAKDINIFGVSRGAELSLLLASRYPFIKKVFGIAPHAYCFQGIDYFKKDSSWTYEGKELPYIHWKSRWVMGNLIKCFFRNEPFGYTYLHKKALTSANNLEDARIKIENAQADLRLVTSKECNMWNTYDGSKKIIETLRQYKYQHKYDLLVYENAGEPYPAPYVIPAGLSSVKIAPRLVLSMGGTVEGNARYSSESWKKAIEFFRE